MKLELQRQDFLKALQTAEKVASTKAVMEFVNSVKVNAAFDGVTIEATDLKTTVKCKAGGAAVIEPGTAVLPIAVLSGMLKRYKSDTAVIEVKGTKGVLIAEGSKTKFPTVPVDEFPNVPESEGAELMCEISSPELSRIIIEGAVASSQPQEFPKYMGTCLLRTSDGRLKAVSTDGKRLAVSEVFCNVSRDIDVLLPSVAVKDLAKQMAAYDENVRILSDGSTVWFALDSVEFSIRKIEASFPDYARILSDETNTTLSMPCDKLMASVERVDIIARTTTAHIMVMDMKPEGQLKLTARSPDFGVAGEFLEAEVTGEPLKIGFNSSYFIDGLKSLGDGDVLIEFSSTEGQTRMKRKDDTTFLYMIMPSRLSQQDIVDDELDSDSDSDETETPDDMPEEHTDWRDGFLEQ